MAREAGRGPGELPGLRSVPRPRGNRSLRGRGIRFFITLYDRNPGIRYLSRNIFLDSENAGAVIR